MGSDCISDSCLVLDGDYLGIPVRGQQPRR